MQFAYLIGLSVMAVSATAALMSPGLKSGIKIFKRVNPSPVECGPDNNKRAWPLESVQDAFDALIQNDRLPGGQRAKADQRTYPRQYGGTNATPSDLDVIAALNGIEGCHTNQEGYKFFEFPITDPVFAGSLPPEAQGPDRVIAIAQNIGQGNQRSFTYCLAITHSGGFGMKDGSFRPCTSV